MDRDDRRREAFWMVARAISPPIEMGSEEAKHLFKMGDIGPRLYYVDATLTQCFKQCV